MPFTLAWIALFLAAPVLCAPTWRRLGLVLLVFGYAAALGSGQLGVEALPAFGALGLAAYCVAPQRVPALRVAGHGLAVGLAFALSLHWLPGFHNPGVLGPLRITPDAVPFSMTLNLDKPLFGFWLLLALPWVNPPRPWRTACKAALAGWLATATVFLMLACALGLVAWAPKWPAGSGLWLLINLLFVSISEEALFRGYLQGGLGRFLAGRRGAEWWALVLTAFLFGLAHLAGGWAWALSAGVAGLGYGLAYRYGGLPAAVVAHFGLNATHFFLFTYPMLQMTG
jgi:membrane protease YdiL (CAAX protease family)